MRKANLSKRLSAVKKNIDDNDLRIEVTYKDGHKKRYYDLVEGFIHVLMNDTIIEEADLVGDLIPDFMRD